MEDNNDGIDECFVPFGTGTAVRLDKSDDLSSVLWSSVNSILDRNSTNRTFFGSIPSSLMRDDIPLLFRGDKRYMVMEKTHGMRFIMFLTTVLVEGATINQPVIAMLDRVGNWVLVSIPAIPSLFQGGTLLDGELVRNYDDTFTFVMFDIFCVSGKRLVERSFVFRHKELNRVVSILKNSNRKATESKESSSSSFPFVIGSKAFLHIGDIRKLCVEVIPKLPYPSDGILMIPVSTGIQFGHHSSLFKLKTGTDNTVDFLMRLIQGTPNNRRERLVPLKKMPVYPSLQVTSERIKVELWSSQYNRSSRSYEFVLFTHTLLTVDDLTRLHLRHFEDADDIVVEFRRNNDTMIWQPEIIRKKRFPNLLSTVLKTIQNIEENIHKEELYIE
jgi:hypothetical protein